MEPIISIFALVSGLLEIKSRVSSLLLLTLFHMPCFLEITEGLKGRVIQLLLPPRLNFIIAWHNTDLLWCLFTLFISGHQLKSDTTHKITLHFTSYCFLISEFTRRSLGPSKTIRWL